MIEILRIGAAHREIDILHTPVVRIAESEDHMISDLLPFRRRFMLRSQPPLPGLIENLLAAILELDLLSRLPPETPDVEPRFIRFHYFVCRAGALLQKFSGHTRYCDLS
jgi:hypothetical protein